LIIARLDEGSSPPPSSSGIFGVRLDAPTLAGIRLVFGVGRRPGTPPTRETFSPVYTISIPVFSLGGLDSDGVYEFDAARTLADLQERADRRGWAMRLELEIEQAADSVSAADIYVETPYADDGPEFYVAGPDGKGTTTLGGGRRLVLASSLAHDTDTIRKLGGAFSLQLSDADPRAAGGEGSGEADQHSSARPVELNLTRYEFQS
jgi:hypothetical protein